MPFAAIWMDLETVILSDVSQREKDKYNMISFISGILKMITKELSYKTEIELQKQQTNLWLPGAKWGKDKLKNWD